MQKRLRFNDMNRSELVTGGGKPDRLLPQFGHWCAEIPKIALYLLEEATDLPEWAVKALQEVARYPQTPCEVSLEGPGITGQLTLPCDWGAVMGGCEESLLEQGRLGKEVEAKTGLRVRFAQFDWPTSTATFYVASR